MSFIINLIGNATRLWIVEIPNEVYDKHTSFRDKHELTLSDFYLDLDILKNLGFNHWSKISNSTEFLLFDLDPKNKIEIKNGRKFITKITANEIISYNSLFPFYHFETAPLNFEPKEGFVNLLIKQTETGTIAKYEFESDDLNVQEIEFNAIIDPIFSLAPFLNKIKYKGKELKIKQVDSMVRGICVEEIK